jgi:hypothetical protein
VKLNTAANCVIRRLDLSVTTQSTENEMCESVQSGEENERLVWELLFYFIFIFLTVGFEGSYIRLKLEHPCALGSKRGI